MRRLEDTLVLDQCGHHLPEITVAAVPTSRRREQRASSESVYLLHTADCLVDLAQLGDFSKGCSTVTPVIHSHVARDPVFCVLNMKFYDTQTPPIG